MVALLAAHTPDIVPVLCAKAKPSQERELRGEETLPLVGYRKPVFSSKT